MNYKAILIASAGVLLLGIVTAIWGLDSTFFEIVKLITNQFRSGFFGYFCLSIRPTWLCQLGWTFLVMIAISFIIYRLVTKDKDRI